MQHLLTNFSDSNGKTLKITSFPKLSCPIRLLLISLLAKQQKIMGLGSYWVRKDDQTGEAKTVKPWEESVSNGDKHYPDPKGKQE